MHTFEQSKFLKNITAHLILLSQMTIEIYIDIIHDFSIKDRNICKKKNNQNQIYRTVYKMILFFFCTKNDIVLKWNHIFYVTHVSCITQWHMIKCKNFLLGVRLQLTYLASNAFRTFINCTYDLTNEQKKKCFKNLKLFF